MKYLVELFEQDAEVVSSELSARETKQAEWRWRIRSKANAKIVASSGEGFVSKSNAQRAAETLLANLDAKNYLIIVPETPRTRKAAK